MKRFWTWLVPTILVVPVATTQADVVVDFDSLPVPATGYNNGDLSLGATHREPFTITGQGNNDYGDFETEQYFESDGVLLGNRYATGGSGDTTYDYWSGWSWSDVVDTTNGGYQNQYAAWPGGGSDGTGAGIEGNHYGVAFGDQAWLTLPDQYQLVSIDLANTTYAAKTMLEGINGGKTFGGASGQDPDFFSVTLHGFDGLGPDANQIATETVFLADYRFADSSQDYVLDQWLTVDLSSFQNVRQLRLSFDGSDVSAFGLITPAYVAMDRLRLTAVPEPGTSLVWLVAGLGIAIRRRRF